MPTPSGRLQPSPVHPYRSSATTMIQPNPTAISIDDEHPTVEFGPPAGNRIEVVRAGVLKALGRPPSLFRVTVAPLWNDHFRVNVFTGSSETGIAIPNSYFVTTNAAGAIVRSAPPILRRY